VTSSPSTSRVTPVEIAGPAGVLEGLLQHHEGARTPLSALVCHPHPLYGGTMHNKVAHRVASTLHGLGATVLRFNFRGAGRSAGTHDAGRGELEDARAALAWLRERTPGARTWVAGFSFGSWIAARLAASDAGVERLILIAPPVRKSDFAVLHHARLPKLVVQGTADVTCRPEDLEREFPLWAEPKVLVMVPGATHFFDTQLGALADALVQVLSEPARSATSQTT
jgi:alpha/beta superfamily hydrolase